MRPHSPSSLGVECPRKWYVERVVGGLPPTTSHAAERGTAIHRQLERAVNGDDDWPAAFPHVRDAYSARCAGAGVQAERKLAVDRECRPCLFDSEDAWVRGIVDLLLWEAPRVVAVDWKSGKRFPRETSARPKAQDQMDVYAALVFLHSAEVREVETRIEWLVSKWRDTVVYTREADMDRLVGRVREQALTLDVKVVDATGIPARIDELFPPRASGLCRAGYCPVLSCTLNTGQGRELIEPTPPIRFKKR